jgi:mannose-6-phosphate isomerase-like protein (cupin superfamily)
MVRRIVTEEVGGRSRVASAGPAPHTWCDEIWITTPDEPLGEDPGSDPRPVAAPPEAVMFRMVSLSPHEEIKAVMAAQNNPEIDAEGFHRTATVDYVMVLDGPVELVLDDGSINIEAGDCVVQRSTNHAWRNHGTAPIRLLTVMIGVQGES